MSFPMAVLAGGLATRLRPITETIPKALINIAGKPFAEHQVRLFRRGGIDRVVFLVGHLGERIRETLGDGSRFGLVIEYVFDGPTLLGTGGAVRKALPVLGDTFFITYGDSYLECDFEAVARAFTESGAAGLMTVFRNDGQWDASNVHFEEGRVLSYDKINKTPAMRHIDYGLGILSARAVQSYPPDRPLDLATVYQDLLAAGELAAYEVTNRFYEIGSPAGLEETRAYLSDTTAI